MSAIHVADGRDAEIEALKLRVRGLENELRKAKARVYYAEGAAREADETICPMAIGDPHHTCGLAETLADTLARATVRDPTLSEWLEATAEESDRP